MKNILKLAGLLVIAILVITCTPKKSEPQTSSEVTAMENPPETVPYEPTDVDETSLAEFQMDGITSVSGAFDGVITAQVENGDILNSIITGFGAIMRNPDGIIDEQYSLSGVYANGGFTITLPDSLDVILASMAGFPGYIHVSDRTARCCYFYEIIGFDSNSSHSAQFELSEIIGGYLGTKYYVSFWYVDRDFTINGSAEGNHFNMNLKKGWNKVYVIEELESGNEDKTTTPPNCNVKWQFVAG
jgi:hypothetical protein